METRTVDHRSWIVLSAAVFIAIMWNAITGPVQEPRAPIRELSVAEAKALIDAGAVVIDVRDATIAATSHVNGALLIPLEVLNSKLPALEDIRARNIVVYCGDGSTRGPEATGILNKAGFTQAANMTHGLQGWRAAGLPTTGV